ncbi:hypothetical protein [Turneriella parva]|uniref:Lipoprotein n=1 Tax=Turneriella parva (strain ATCC BAA-1111 / DSM 21527 / NCTC 11395 / H) TaxID=869212 RepID=I4B8D2_TURPD|nr:hypothetical protein [Turneriella parva]AFM13539.1 hypothetical protein Turpa_2900 [Turneriella parva DSM 21527]
MRMSRIHNAARLLLIAGFVTQAAGCAQVADPTLEYINPPINLSIALVATQTYQLSFYSDNREGGFAGYGVFTGASAASVSTAAKNMSTDIAAAQGFCSVPQQAEYRLVRTIQVGPNATGSTICDITTLTLVSGQWVGLRARVERPEEPWSAAAFVQVP